MCQQTLISNSSTDICTDLFSNLSTYVLVFSSAPAHPHDNSRPARSYLSARMPNGSLNQEHIYLCDQQLKDLQGQEQAAICQRRLQDYKKFNHCRATFWSIGQSTKLISLRWRLKSEVSLHRYLRSANTRTPPMTV